MRCAASACDLAGFVELYAFVVRHLVILLILALTTRAEEFRRGILLVKRGDRVERVRVRPGAEREELLRLSRDPSVQFAELDRVLTRQFQPADPRSSNQWHHGKLHSTNAWAISVGLGGARAPLVQLAILDTPFQMNHPDLQANSAGGWNMITGKTNAFETNGFYHSTIAAGLAGAVLNNGTGIAGMVNCRLVPIDIGDAPTVSDMYNAIVWAADHGIRVVNLSWDGAFSEVINEAGAYLKEKTAGMLFMAGVNGNGRLNYPALPHIYAVSMTDQNDQARSSSGPHIDFAAPGWDVFSTMPGSGYGADSGTSYAAPILAGIAAWIMSAAPELGPAEIEEILKTSCVDLGVPGWDERYGWGRIDFARVAEATFRRSRASRITISRNGDVGALYEAETNYRLFRSLDLKVWQPVPEAAFRLAGEKILFQDAEELQSGFYRIEITRPR